MIIQDKLVLIKKPEIEKAPSGIELLPEAVAQKEQEMISKLGQVEVAFIGQNVTFCKVGDTVLISPSKFQYADFVFIKGETYFIFNENQIIGKL